MSFQFYCEMTDEELEKVDLVQFTKLNVGDRVTHKNAGKRYCPPVGCQGTILSHQNQGCNAWGGLVVTVDVAFDNGDQFRMVYDLAVKAV